MEPPLVYISYAPADGDLSKDLVEHLAPLVRDNAIRIWHQGRVSAGENVHAVCDAHLHSARVVILLVSASYIASDYHYNQEMTVALNRARTGATVVIPVLARAHDWEKAPFSEFEPLPHNQRPITSWPNRDEAWADVIRGIRKVAETFTRPSTVRAASSPSIEVLRKRHDGLARDTAKHIMASGPEEASRQTSLDITASRTYFADLDRTTYSQVAWTSDEVDEIRAGLERKLKLLMLLKGHIFVPASHLLESELAREILLSCPSLVTRGIVVPALRSDFATCRAFLDAKIDDRDRAEASLYEGSEPREIADLIDSTARVERWDANGASAWFKTRFLSDLEDDKSLLQSSLRERGFALPADFKSRIDNIGAVSRNAIYRIAKKAGNTRLWEFLCAYADFLYYLGGARAVRAEGVLPQENLVDFSFQELTGRRTRLSEHEVFFKIFIDIVKAMTSTHFPVDLLDALTLDDAVELHDVAMSREFVLKYSLIQEKTKEGLQLADPERLVLLMEEIDEFERDLKRNLEAGIRRELPAHLRHGRQMSTASLLQSLASLLIAFHDAPGAASTLVVSGLNVTDRGCVAETIGRRVRGGLDALDTARGCLNTEDEPILLTFVDRLKARYLEALIDPSR